MKIVLSHDVDHLNWQEHYVKDLFVPKQLIRNTLALLKGRITLQLYFTRLKMWGRMHRIPELMKEYDKRDIRATFFFGMNNALNLSYKKERAIPVMLALKEANHEVGMHTIEVNSPQKTNKEISDFTKLSSQQLFGVRSHYLRLNGVSFNTFSNAQIQYDSTIQMISAPFKIGTLWEIPISIMDANLVPNFMTNSNLEEWTNNCEVAFQEALQKNIPYFVVNFHDVYMSDYYPTIKKWFFNFVDQKLDQGFKFITLNECLQELESSNQ